MPGQPLGSVLYAWTAPWTPVICLDSPLDSCYMPGQPLGLLLYAWTAPWTPVICLDSPLDPCYMPGQPLGPLLYARTASWTPVICLDSLLDPCYLPGQPLGHLLYAWTAPWTPVICLDSPLDPCYMPGKPLRIHFDRCIKGSLIFSHIILSVILTESDNILFARKVKDCFSDKNLCGLEHTTCWYISPSKQHVIVFNGLYPASGKYEVMSQCKSR